MTQINPASMMVFFLPILSANWVTASAPTNDPAGIAATIPPWAVGFGCVRKIERDIFSNERTGTHKIKGLEVSFILWKDSYINYRTNDKRLVVRSGHRTWTRYPNRTSHRQCTRMNRRHTEGEVKESRILLRCDSQDWTQSSHCKL